jgi:hypothetical protein
LVVIVSEDAMIRLKAFCVVCCGEPLSVKRIVKLNEPSAAGVPLKVPLEERLIPAGRESVATTQVYGDVPPLPVKVWE